MPETQKDIRRKLIRRLFFGWLILSVLIGIIVFFIELERIDDFVVNFALEESNLFTRDEKGYIDVNSANYEKLLQLSLHQIKERHFVIVEFYDKNKKRIVEVAHPQKASIEAEINKHKHDFLMGDTVEYDKFYMDNTIYLLVLVPLKTYKGIAGYFEGVYEVDETTMKSIMGIIFWSIGLVVIVVLATTLLLYPIIISLNKDLIKLSVDLSEANIGMLKTVGGAIAKRDSETNIHNYRVTIYTIRLAEAAGLSAGEIRAIIKGAFLHDVGKIGVSDSILLKPAKLSSEEFEIMKTHVQHGVDIISKYNWLKDAMNVVKYHHEKYGGSGYITGLSGEDIPVNARIFAIADYFDALTSNRPYKESFSLEKTMQILEENRGTHFDPKILDSFSMIAKALYTETNGMSDSDLEETLDRIVEKYFHNA